MSGAAPGHHLNQTRVRGPGRNALYLASAGFTVHAVDLSPAAIAWATDRARDTGTGVATQTRQSQQGGKLRRDRPNGIPQRYTLWYAHHDDQG
ncbi:MAG: hypothetical protein ACRDRX_20650 [Pseudonocardiaceae bacterium]